jgi:hypothetical protein
LGSRSSTRLTAFTLRPMIFATHMATPGPPENNAKCSVMPCARHVPMRCRFPRS